jgi:hypothetical protein
MIMLVLGLVGCDRGVSAKGKQEVSRAPDDAVIGRIHDARAVPDALESSAAPPLAYPAVRCSECHDRMHDEWMTSAHANARRSPIYRRMRENSNDDTCDRCHAPLASRLPASDLAADEGVSCEVCHNIKDVEVRRAGGKFYLHLEDQVKYGPLCDAEDHYFHRMGCSPLHQHAELCAGCHLYYRTLAGGEELPVYTEYEEWRDEYQNRGMSCQKCHMPGTRAEVASGAGERNGVSNHSLLGRANDLRRRALKATAVVRANADGLEIEVEVRNVGAGHRVPTGLPDRRIVVRAVSITSDGKEHVAAEQRFGRKLVDDGGMPAPSYLATRVASDDRILPKSSRTARLVLATPPAGELRIEIAWHAIDRDIAERLKLGDVEVIPLLRGSMALGAKLPKKIELK